MTDRALELQHAAEAHLEACEQAQWCEQGECDLPGHDGTTLVCPSPATAPFCGCQTCVVREVLAHTYDVLLELAKEDALPKPPAELRWVRCTQAGCITSVLAEQGDRCGRHQ